MIKHKFVSGKSAAADPTIVDGPAWDDTHVLDGGSTGQVLTRDPAFDPPAGDGWKWSFVLTAMLIDAILSADAAGRAKMADGFITAPKIGDGQVTVPKLRRLEASAENAAPVTVLNAPTDVVTLDLGTVQAGDRIFVWSETFITKGATQGTTTVAIGKASGTATIELLHNRPSCAMTLDPQQAGQSTSLPISTNIKVTGTGTLVLRIFSQSFGSNATVNTGACEIYAFVIPGA